VQPRSGHPHAQSQARSVADRRFPTGRDRFSVPRCVRLIARTGEDEDAQGIRCCIRCISVCLRQKLAGGSNRFRNRAWRCQGLLEVALRDLIAANAEIKAARARLSPQQDPGCSTVPARAPRWPLRSPRAAWDLEEPEGCLHVLRVGVHALEQGLKFGVGRGSCGSRLRLCTVSCRGQARQDRRGYRNGT